ncbi:MAG: carbonic anhydrase [Candidatus Anstonellales archaeon]
MQRDLTRFLEINKGPLADKEKRNIPANVVAPLTLQHNPFVLKLLEGNKRFCADQGNVKVPAEKRESLALGQKPFASILCCSDSRVSPEIIFDCSLGEIFVVRNAGNVVDISTLASLEYAAEHLGVSLILVLGHEKCGAVIAAASFNEKQHNSKSIEQLLTKIGSLTKDSKIHDPEDLCIKNILNSVSEIRKSNIISKLESDGKLIVLGAKYFISTGRVEIIGGIPSFK